MQPPISPQKTVFASADADNSHLPPVSSVFKGVWVMLRIALHLMWACILVTWYLPYSSVLRQRQTIQKWSQQLLSLMGIQWQVRGRDLAQGPVLRVCNHISWLDIYVLFALGHCRFVSKAEVRKWPVIGRLTQGVGTLFVERTAKRDAMRVVHHMAEQLANGEVLVVFPEGTTSDGSSVLPFHANLLQAAIVTNCPVQPLALEYYDALRGSRSDAPVYIGQDSLVGSLWRIACARGLQVIVTIGPATLANGRDRRTWASDLHNQIVSLRT